MKCHEIWFGCTMEYITCKEWIDTSPPPPLSDNEEEEDLISTTLFENPMRIPRRSVAIAAPPPRTRIGLSEALMSLANLSR